MQCTEVQMKPFSLESFFKIYFMRLNNYESVPKTLFLNCLICLSLLWICYGCDLKYERMNKWKKVKLLAWPLTWVSISSSLCLFSRSSAWASASRSLTLISSSCSSLNVFFLWLSFQRPAVRAKWRWQKVAGKSVAMTTEHTDHSLLTGAYLPVIFQVSDLLPQLFEASQSLSLSQLGCNQLLLQTCHVGVIW